MPTTPTTMAALNDRFRRGVLQRPSALGRACLTGGVQRLNSDALRALLMAIVRFEDFAPENDPYGEHDFGRVEYEETDYFWKIDYFRDDSMAFGSDDPSASYRVLTVMRADEY